MLCTSSCVLESMPFRDHAGYICSLHSAVLVCVQRVPSVHAPTDT